MGIRTVTIGLATLLGVFCTTGSALAEGSGLTAARDRAAASPSSADAALAYGRALRRAGQETEALAELQRAKARLAGWPNLVAEVEWEIARTHVARRDFAQAMNTCVALGAIVGGKAAGHVCAAEAHLLWRRGSEASQELALAAKLGDRSQGVAYASKVAEGRVRELEVKDAEAEAAYQAAIAAAPDRADAHVLLGALLHRTGKDGLTELRKAVEVDPNDPVAQLELGRALPRGSAPSLAALEKAVSLRPTFVDGLRELSDGYVVARRIGDAKRTAEAALRLAPNDVTSHVIAGRVALAEGRADDALKLADAATKIMPNVAGAKLLRGDAFAKKGEIDLAVEAYQAAFGLDRSDPSSLLSGARACVEAGRLTTAKAFAARATKDFASFASSWVALGDALAADKDKQGARSAYETAKSLPNADRATVDQKLASLR